MFQLLLFLFLQGCDLATTLWFLHLGIHEGNPLVAGILAVTGSPAFSLALLKAAAAGLAFFAWKRGSTGLLRRLNLFFLVCVAWNLAAIARLGNGG